MPSNRAENTWQSLGGDDFLQLVSQGGKVLGGIDSNSVPYGALGLVQQQTVNISSQQILSVNPIPVLPQPGPGVFYSILQAVVRYNFGTVAYAFGGSGLAFVTVQGNDLLSPVLQTDITAAASTIELWSPADVFTTAPFANNALELFFIGGSPTLGNGNLSITFVYTLQPSAF